MKKQPHSSAVHHCYLCGNQATYSSPDYGHIYAIHCTNCQYYEITDGSLSRIMGDDFPEDQKKYLIKQIKEINSKDRESVALVTWDNVVKVKE